MGRWSRGWERFPCGCCSRLVKCWGAPAKGNPPICEDCIGKVYGPAGQGKTSDMGDTTKEYPIPDELKEKKND